MPYLNKPRGRFSLQHHHGIGRASPSATGAARPNRSRRCSYTSPPLSKPARELQHNYLKGVLEALFTQAFRWLLLSAAPAAQPDLQLSLRCSDGSAPPEARRERA